MSLFFFNDTATTEIYTLSLHDALPISTGTTNTVTFRTYVRTTCSGGPATTATLCRVTYTCTASTGIRSEEHTSELQSRQYLVCRLLLEKKKKKYSQYQHLSSYKSYGKD